MRSARVAAVTTSAAAEARATEQARAAAADAQLAAQARAAVAAVAATQQSGQGGTCAACAGMRPGSIAAAVICAVSANAYAGDQPGEAESSAIVMVAALAGQGFKDAVPTCFNCRTPGHFGSTCAAPCFLCVPRTGVAASHPRKDCPRLKQSRGLDPKSTARVAAIRTAELACH